GSDDPPPGGRERDQRCDRQRRRPAGNQQPLATDTLGEVAGDEIAERLCGAEGDDEGEDRGGRAQPEVVLSNQRQHAPLEADHAAEERVQADEKRELPRVGAETESDRHQAMTTARPERLAATIRSCSAGSGGMSARSASANAAGSSSERSGL